MKLCAGGDVVGGVEVIMGLVVGTGTEGEINV
jgi:hypothetical protein